MRLVVLFVAVTALALAWPSPSGAQRGRWEPRLVLTGGGIADVVFASESTAWAVGDGAIFLSGDGGRSWRTVHSTPFQLIAVDAAPDGLRGWAVGVLGQVLATSDGGRTWVEQDAGTDIDLSEVVALDGNSAIVAGVGRGHSDVMVSLLPHTIRRTDDGGSTWREVHLPGGYRVGAIDVLDDAAHGWVSGLRCPSEEGSPCDPVQQAVLRTTDGGATWIVVNDDDRRRWFTGMQFKTPDVGWATGYECEDETGVCTAKLFRTSDGGRTWSLVRGDADPGVNAVVAFDARSALVVETACVREECNHTLLETRDGGHTWALAGGPERGYGSELLAFHGRTNGIWGDRWTADGRTWNPRVDFPVTAGSGAFHFLDDTTGWLAASKLLRTMDGGATWQMVSDRRFDEIEFVSAVEGWAVVHECAGLCTARVLHTQDGGLTWEQQAVLSGLQSTSERFVFADAANGWLLAPYDGRLLHTVDAGESWQSMTMPDIRWYNPPSLAVVGKSDLWFAAQECPPGLVGCVIRVFRSSDAGGTWRETGPIEDTQACGSPQVAAFDEAFAWIVAAECATVVRPVVYRTIDGGQTWSAHPLGSVGQVGPVVFFDRLTGRALRAVCDGADPTARCRDVLLRTSDGGVTWVEEDTGLEEGWNFSYRFVSPERAWRLIEKHGLFSVTRQTLYAYVGGQEPERVSPPEVGGQARTRGAPPLAGWGALAAAALLLAQARRRSGCH